jgi:hypothetical protein
MRKRLALPLVLAALLAGGATIASAQSCGFPWTVTARPAGGDNVAISVCGLYTTCTPHDPRVSVTGSLIRVTFTAGELPGCQCVTGDATFRGTVTASVAPASCSVVATLVDCGQPTDVGSATVTLAQSAVIPMLNTPGPAF